MSRKIFAVSAATLALASAVPVAAQQVRFEEPKPVVVQPADGFTRTLDIGAAFAMEFQALDHSNTAFENIVDGKDLNALHDIGAGFNLAGANLTLSAELAPGIRVDLDTYLSSRHHSEAWVKGGYLLMDASPIEWAPLEPLFDYLTVKAGHFELNYGDAHFRRTDNGNAIHNPFVENLILDAFATEIGGEVYLRSGPWLAMAGVTNGLIKGDVTRPETRDLALLGKVGFDQALSEDLRVRLTASTYQNDNAGRATLYAGDRAGSRYFNVLDNASGSAFTNGRMNPNFTEEIAAWQINPFVQVGDLELFGVVELAEGRSLAETELRSVDQYAVDAVYRLLDDRAYVAGRYNVASGEFYAPGAEQSVDRFVVGGGWFMIPGVLLKAEYVNQSYEDFPGTSILNGGRFDGLVVQGAVSF